MEYDPAERLARFPGLNHDFSEIHALSQMPGAELHETKWHLVIYVPGRDRLVFCFDNIASITAEGPRQPWGMALLRKQGWGVIGVVPKLPDWYRSPELFDVLEDMRDRGVFAAYPAVSMFGTSMGAFAAAAFAPLAPRSSTKLVYICGLSALLIESSQWVNDIQGPKFCSHTPTAVSVCLDGSAGIFCRYVCSDQQKR